MACHNAQESQVSSTQDRTTWMKTSDETRSVSDASEPEVPFNSRDPGNLVKLDESELNKKFSWFASFNEKRLDLLTKKCDLNFLNSFIMEFVSTVSTDVTECYNKPNRAAKLKNVLNDYIMFFHLMYLHMIRESPNAMYLNRMSDLLAMYIDMEIRAYGRRKESVKIICGRLTAALFVFLRYSMDHVLDTLLKTRMMSNSSMEVSVPILRRVLRDKPSEPMSEMTYVRYILVYKLWKKVVKCVEERRRINMQASESVIPPCDFKQMPIPRIVGEVLPDIPKNCSKVTQFFVQAKFDIKEKATVFLKMVHDPGRVIEETFVPNILPDPEKISIFSESRLKAAANRDTSNELIALMDDLYFSLNDEPTIEDSGDELFNTNSNDFRTNRLNTVYKNSPCDTSPNKTVMRNKLTKADLSPPKKKKLKVDKVNNKSSRLKSKVSNHSTVDLIKETFVIEESQNSDSNEDNVINVESPNSGVIKETVINEESQNSDSIKETVSINVESQNSVNASDPVSDNLEAVNTVVQTELDSDSRVIEEVITDANNLIVKKEILGNNNDQTPCSDVQIELDSDRNFIEEVITDANNLIVKSEILGNNDQTPCSDVNIGNHSSNDTSRPLVNIDEVKEDEVQAVVEEKDETNVVAINLPCGVNNDVQINLVDRENVQTEVAPENNETEISTSAETRIELDKDGAAIVAEKDKETPFVNVDEQNQETRNDNEVKVEEEPARTASVAEDGDDDDDDDVIFVESRYIDSVERHNISRKSALNSSMNFFSLQDDLQTLSIRCNQSESRENSSPLAPEIANTGPEAPPKTSTPTNPGSLSFLELIETPLANNSIPCETPVCGQVYPENNQTVYSQNAENLDELFISDRLMPDTDCEMYQYVLPLDLELASSRVILGNGNIFFNGCSDLNYDDSANGLISPTPEPYFNNEMDVNMSSTDIGCSSAQTSVNQEEEEENDEEQQHSVSAGSPVGCNENSVSNKSSSPGSSPSVSSKITPPIAGKSAKTGTCFVSLSRTDLNGQRTTTIMPKSNFNELSKKDGKRKADPSSNTDESPPEKKPSIEEKSQTTSNSLQNNGNVAREEVISSRKDDNSRQSVSKSGSCNSVESNSKDARDVSNNSLSSSKGMLNLKIIPRQLLYDCNNYSNKNTSQDRFRSFYLSEVLPRSRSIQLSRAQLFSQNFININSVISSNLMKSYTSSFDSCILNPVSRACNRPNYNHNARTGRVFNKNKKLFYLFEKCTSSNNITPLNTNDSKLNSENAPIKCNDCIPKKNYSNNRNKSKLNSGSDAIKCKDYIPEKYDSNNRNESKLNSGSDAVKCKDYIPEKYDLNNPNESKLNSGSDAIKCKDYIPEKYDSNNRNESKLNSGSDTIKCKDCIPEKYDSNNRNESKLNSGRDAIKCKDYIPEKNDSNNLPLKKRKVIVSDANIVEDKVHKILDNCISYPCTPMLSIAQINLDSTKKGESKLACLSNNKFIKSIGNVNSGLDAFSSLRSIKSDNNNSANRTNINNIYRPWTDTDCSVRDTRTVDVQPVTTSVNEYGSNKVGCDPLSNLIEQHLLNPSKLNCNTLTYLNLPYSLYTRT